MRLRVCLEVAKGRPLEWLADAPAIAEVAELFHRLVEADPASEVEASALEAHLREHTEDFAPFGSFREAAAFMELPVADGKFAGVACRAVLVKTAPVPLTGLLELYPGTNRMPIAADTRGATLRNANHQLRSEPANPRTVVSVWNNSTIEADLGRRPLEIDGSC